MLIAFGRIGCRNPFARKNIINLTDGNHVLADILQRVHYRWLRRLHGVVMTVRRAHEFPRFADIRAGDYAAY
ncbi:hypothetical protein D3C81_1935640 [compost metagenome]